MAATRPVREIGKDLCDDGDSLMKVLSRSGDWKSDTDAKLESLFQLLTKRHPNQKVIVFTQFADTVRYLEEIGRAHV